MSLDLPALVREIAAAIEVAVWRPQPVADLRAPASARGYVAEKVPGGWLTLTCITDGQDVYDGAGVHESGVVLRMLPDTARRACEIAAEQTGGRHER